MVKEEVVEMVLGALARGERVLAVAHAYCAESPDAGGGTRRSARIPAALRPS